MMIKSHKKCIILALLRQFITTASMKVKNVNTTIMGNTNKFYNYVNGFDRMTVKS